MAELQTDFYPFLFQGSDGLIGNATITIPQSEYIEINDHHRYIKLSNMLGEQEATISFKVEYEILVSFIA